MRLGKILGLGKKKKEVKPKPVEEGKDNDVTVDRRSRNKPRIDEPTAYELSLQGTE